MVGLGGMSGMGNVGHSQVSAAADRPALRYAHHAVGYINVDAQCDKLVTDDRRQFITLSVHLG